MFQPLLRALTLSLAFSALTAAVARADTPQQPGPDHHDSQSWAISMDNDMFSFANTDRDFTAGMAISYTGRPGLRYWKPLDDFLGYLNRLHGLGAKNNDPSRIVPSIEIGEYGFTPRAIENTYLTTDDRPYASLTYLSISRVYRPDSHADGWSSSLTLGFLGLNIFDSTQNEIHRVTGNQIAEGWRYQISNGGEPTFRYQVAYHDFWHNSSPTARFKTTYFGSVGYLTEAGIALSTREGRISSPDYRFMPELVTYGEKVNDVADGVFHGPENYFWGGVALKLRVYNAFLQGQFRHSDHTYNSSELRAVLAEAWIGYTASFGDGIKLSYVFRAQTSEIRVGKADRSLVWGGLVLSQAF